MAKQNVPDMKELFKQAADIAKQVPENMQEAAFNRALDLLMGGKPNSGTIRQTGTRKGKTATEASSDGPDENNVVERLLREIDSTQHQGMTSSLKVLDRALMVLQIALDDHKIDGLSPMEIARILTEKFRISTTYRAVSMALGRATKLVNRVPSGNGFTYRIVAPGKEHLAHLATGGAPNVAAPRSRRKRKHTKKSQKKASGDDSTKASGSGKLPTKKKARSVGNSKSAASTKPGPKAAILGPKQAYPGSLPRQVLVGNS